jgi:hypothetical protein
MVVTVQDRPRSRKENFRYAFAQSAIEGCSHLSEAQ